MALATGPNDEEEEPAVCPHNLFICVVILTVNNHCFSNQY